jgi:broad specificity phosphatase PhoE
MNDTIPTSDPNIPLIYVIRHGEALHNIQRGYPGRDPPLTETGNRATEAIKLPVIPDLIIISPMTRAIQTAINAFPALLGTIPSKIPVQIWPELREAHDAECNKGLPRAAIAAKFPQFNFAECPEEWDYPQHTIEGATARAENVRVRLKQLSGTYSNIVIVTHRGLISFLAKGRRFDVCEVRSFRWATGEELEDETVKKGVNCDTLLEQEFGPTVMVFHKSYK